MSSPASNAPRIVVTVAVAARQSDPAIAARKNALYAESVTRHGGEAVVLDATSDEGTRAAAFASMDGLLISGGADLHPERYGQPSRGSLTMEPDRDALEARGLDRGAGARPPRARRVPRLPGDQRVLGRHAPPARRRPPGAALGEWRGEDPSAPGRARHATRPDPLPDQRRRRGPARQLVPPPGRPGRPTWRRGSSPTPGRAARPAT